MSKVIMFSRYFPAYHPRKGEPTFFVEQILNGIAEKASSGVVDRNKLPREVLGIVNDFVLLDGTEVKHHTIRAGNRWNVGDKFSPRIWGNDINPKNGRSGPYQSKQIQFAPDIEIKKVWEFKVENVLAWINNEMVSAQTFEKLATNDGLSEDDLERWFKMPKEFYGQIICWNENINY